MQKIGETKEHPACGQYGLGIQNERGTMLLEWMRDNGLIALNTCFQHRKKERYSWISPGGAYKNTIDYIIIRRRNLKECHDARALVSADCVSDHQMIWAKLKGRFWNSVKKRKEKKPKIQLDAWTHRDQSRIREKK